MVLNVHKNHKAYQGRGEGLGGVGGGGEYGSGGGERLYTRHTMNKVNETAGSCYLQRPAVTLDILFFSFFK